MSYKLILGKSEDKLTEISDSSVDLIVTSPPYDSIRDYNGYSLDLNEIGKQCYRVMKDGSILAMVIADGTKNFGKSITVARTIVSYVDMIGFKLFEDVIYHRHGRPGAWWNKRFRVDHEHILLFLKGDRPKHFDKEPLKIDAIHAGESWHITQRLTSGKLIPIDTEVQKPKKCRGTVWFYNTSSTERNKIKMKHPATFPDKLAEDLIACFSSIGDTVLDPFMGSGTTIRMAEKLGRNSIGIDISDTYVDLAREILRENV